MNFNENELWRDKTELLNIMLSKLPNAKVLLKQEFDTKDQVLFDNIWLVGMYFQGYSSHILQKHVLFHLLMYRLS